MVITDYNKMNIEEIMVIYEFIGISFLIEDGRITGEN